ncbi:hypothetical protein [Roseomonas haemaphysalidis]|uniref:Uncharacterized protein n=1 Tax=Roseomonas haemaphysalidis TaxID=2768162 RepID=A0ABS3KTQ4_9PROT|nr:hypothetical protein [Roseomonas haemaphysalidis]MBO1080857.1 hypothetical protein [Roseomonas haemaphysalidis]
MSETRLMTRAALRAYLHGLPWGEINARMEAHRLPKPLWNTPPDHPAARWDRKAVDRALDAASGMPLTVEAGTAFLDKALGFR